MAEVWVLFQCRFHPAEGSRVTGTELLLRMHVVHTVHTTSAPLHSVQLIMYRLRIELFFYKCNVNFYSNDMKNIHAEMILLSGFLSVCYKEKTEISTQCNDTLHKTPTIGHFL